MLRSNRLVVSREVPAVGWDADPHRTVQVKLGVGLNGTDGRGVLT